MPMVNVLESTPEWILGEVLVNSGRGSHTPCFSLDSTSGWRTVTKVLSPSLCNKVGPPGSILCRRTELVFVDLLRSPKIDSQPGGTVRQPYLSFRPDRLHRLAKSNPRNRFLGSINVYKYGLCTHVPFAELVFLNVYGARALIPRNEFRQPM
jgi:hypothetical protein